MTELYVTLELTCSFCEEPGGDRRRVLQGTGVAICSECLANLQHQLDRVISGDLNLPPMGELDVTDEQLLTGLAGHQHSVKQAEAALHDAVRRLRERRVTWARIGEALGVSRQAAWERFGGDE